MFSADVLVAEAAHLVFGLLQRLAKVTAQGRFSGVLQSGRVVEAGLKLRPDCSRLHSENFEDTRDNSAILAGEREKQMVDVEGGVLTCLRLPLGGNDCLPGFVG